MASATADWRAAFLEAAAAVEEDVGADGACNKAREKIDQPSVFTVRAH